MFHRLGLVVLHDSLAIFLEIKRVDRGRTDLTVRPGILVLPHGITVDPVRHLRTFSVNRVVVPIPPAA